MLGFGWMRTVFIENQQIFRTEHTVDIEKHILYIRAERCANSDIAIYLMLPTPTKRTR